METWTKKSSSDMCNTGEISTPTDMYIYKYMCISVYIYINIVNKHPLLVDF